MYTGGYSTKIRYDDSVLPTGAGTTTLFDTTVACTGKGQLQAGHIKKFCYNIVHDENGSIRLDKSDDRGATFVTVRTTAHTAGTSEAEIPIEYFDDFRVVWVNGGTDQTSWHVDLALSDQRAVA